MDPPRRASLFTAFFSRFSPRKTRPVTMYPPFVAARRPRRFCGARPLGLVIPTTFKINFFVKTPLCRFATNRLSPIRKKPNDCSLIKCGIVNAPLSQNPVFVSGGRSPSKCGSLPKTPPDFVFDCCSPGKMFCVSTGGVRLPPTGPGPL